MASPGDAIDHEVRFGWWSESHLMTANRILVYTREDGSEIRLTGVTSMPNAKGYGWEDARPMGRLKGLVRVELTKPFEPPVAHTT